MIFDKISQLKVKFKSFFVSRKKLKALENYSSCAPFKYRESLSLIKRCMEESFLNEKGVAFMDSMLDEYHVNFLDWAHRTKWLKGEMARMANKCPVERQLDLFSLDPILHGNRRVG